MKKAALRASHIVLAIIGFVASIWLALSIRTRFDTLGSDASDDPYSALYVYTPFVDPGQRASVKLFFQGGDGIDVTELHASIDGARVGTANKQETPRRPSRRFDMGKLEIELDVLVPSEMAPGEHVLAFDTQARCQGSDFSRACHPTHLEAPIRVGGAAGAKVLAVLKALGAALFVFFALRLGWDRTGAWLNTAEKRSGAVLAPAFIALLVVWAGASYSLFARPIGAALGTSSNALYAATIIAWLAVLPVAVRTRKRVVPTDITIATVRVLDEEPEAASEEAQPGYREPAAREKREPIALDALATILRDRYHLRYRRDDTRLVPRWFRSAPVTFEAEAPDDLAKGFRMEGDRGYFLVFLPLLAKELGRLHVTVGEKSVTVEKDDTPLDLRSRI